MSPKLPVTGGRRPLLAYAVGALVTWAIATATFVAYRNHEHEHRELERAREAVRAVADGHEPLTKPLAAGLVDAAKASAKYPFLKHRRLVGAKGRALGGPTAPPEDKLLADAAARAEREGPFARFLPDATGRIVAALPAPAGRPRASGVAVVLTNPVEAPAPYPVLVVGGLLALGALLAWSSTRVARGAGRTALLGTGLAALAPPAAVWGGPLPALAIVAVAALVAAVDHRGVVARAARAARVHKVAYTYIVPAAVGMAVLVIVPFVVGTTLGFFDHLRGEWHYVGLSNFRAILSGDGHSFTDPLNFWFTLAVTIAWTAVNVALHVSVGVLLALALREKWIRARGVWRMLLILPWAVPNYITALIWRGMFQRQYGAVNALLETLGLEKVGWFSHFATSFAANVTTNTWLGFPFMMVVALGALESIPNDLYEAASVDGATSVQRFFHITLPNLRPALLPAVVLGSIWTFNMFNVIYLVSGGKPAGATDILVTQAYRWAFERGQRYGMAAAYATIIFLILVAWTLLANRLATSKEVKACKLPRWYVQTLVHVAVILATALTLYPIVLVLKKAVEPGQEFALSASPIPQAVTTQHFADILAYPHIGSYVLNSIMVSLATTIVGVSLSCTAAYALSRFRFPGRKVGLATFLVVQMFPSTLLMIPLYVLLHRMGLLNTLAGLVLVYATTAIPFCVYTLKGYFDTLPRELEEAARIDGASPWGVFFRVVLPLARPAIAVTALFSFMTAWNEFILAGTFMTDETSYTLPVLLHHFIGEYHAEWGHFAAGAILTSLPVMALFYVLQRFLVGGLTSGSVKG